MLANIYRSAVGCVEASFSSDLKAADYQVQPCPGAFKRFCAISSTCSRSVPPTCSRIANSRFASSLSSYTLPGSTVLSALRPLFRSLVAKFVAGELERTRLALGAPSNPVGRPRLELKVHQTRASHFLFELDTIQNLHAVASRRLSFKSSSRYLGSSGTHQWSVRRIRLGQGLLG